MPRKRTIPIETPGARAPISKSVRFAILARDGFKCGYCGTAAAHGRLLVDHVRPISAGGTSERANLIASCEPCNQGKAGKRFVEAERLAADRVRSGWTTPEYFEDAGSVLARMMRQASP